MIMTVFSKSRKTIIGYSFPLTNCQIQCKLCFLSNRKAFRQIVKMFRQTVRAFGQKVRALERPLIIR